MKSRIRGQAFVGSYLPYEMPTIMSRARKVGANTSIPDLQ